MSISADKLKQYQADPMTFFGDLSIPIAGRVPFRTVWQPFQRELLEMAAPCLLAIAAGKVPPHRGLSMMGTKGSGKDSLTMKMVLWLLLFAPHAVLIEVGAGDQSQASEGLKILRQLIRLNPWIAQRLDPQTERVVCKATDSVCEFLAANEMTAHGSRPRMTIIAEVTHIPSEGFAQTMMDNASKDPCNFAIVQGNAGFLDSWAWQWRQMAMESERWLVWEYAQPAPWIAPAELEEAKRRNSLSRYRRLFEGVWSSGSDGDSFPDELIDRTNVLDGPLYRRADHTGLIAGLDLGLRHDHSSLCILAIDYQRCRLELASVENWAPPVGGQVDIHAVRDAVLAARDHLGLRCLYYDEWQAAQMAAELRECGIHTEPVYPSAKNKTAEATSLMTVMRNGLLELYGDELLLRDLRQCSIIDKGTGYQVVNPRDNYGHGDRLTALLLCLPAAIECLNNPPPAMFGERIVGTIFDGGLTR